ncbi:ATP-binding protein [Comamonas faecalis]|uniref:ATP-binding protein n=1 Tax=Comamonas faecalis TaxID=1387849 RepID=A0ABP7QKR9_9BURK
MIGYDDQGVAVGVDQASKLLEDIPNKVRDVLGMVVDVDLVMHGTLPTLHIHVPAYPYPISYKGEYHYRSGSTKQELKGAALDRFLLRKQGITWDGVPVPYLQVGDLQDSTMKRFRELAIHNQRLPETIREEGNPLLLERLRLTKDGYLKRATALLFHPEPDRYVTGAAIKIGAFGKNDADLLHHDEITGNLFTQVETAIEVLKLKYLKARISYDGLYRQERFPLPMAALREAILNAVVHKDYATPVAIQISVYPDKLMIWNPGQLPEAWTLEKLLGKHASHPHNPDIANAFFRAGLIESWGRGIERIKDACTQDGYPTPTWALEPGGWWVTFGYAPEDVTGQVTGQVTEPIQRLLSAMVADHSRSELQRILNLRHRDSFVTTYLQPALAAGVIEMTQPEKPTSRLQKYRLTEAGRQWLAAVHKPTEA